MVPHCKTHRNLATLNKKAIFTCHTRCHFVPSFFSSKDFLVETPFSNRMLLLIMPSQIKQKSKRVSNFFLTTAHRLFDSTTPPFVLCFVTHHYLFLFCFFFYKKIHSSQTLLMDKKNRIQNSQSYLLTTFVALPLLNLEGKVKGADWEVYSLRVHSSHLADKIGS